MSFIDRLFNRQTEIYERRGNLTVSSIKDIKGTVLACVERRAVEYSSRRHYFVDNEGVEIDDHPIIDSPNQYQSFAEILRQIEYQLAKHGNAIVHYWEDEARPYMQIFPYALCKINERDGEIRDYQINNKTYGKDQIIHFKTLNLSGSLRSMVIGEPIFLNETATLLGTEIAFIRGANSLAQQGGETPYIIASKSSQSTPGEAKKLEQIRDSYNEKVSEQFKIKSFIPGDVQIIKLSDPAIVDSILKRVDLKVIKENIAEIWSVPRKILENDYNGKATTIGTLYGFHQGVINYMVNQRLEVFNEFFKKHTDIDLELRAEPFSLEETEELRKEHEFRLRWGIMSTEQVQEALGIETSPPRRYRPAGAIEESEFNEEPNLNERD